MNEIWKDIPGFENMYQASNLGNIKSFRRKNEKLVKGVIDKDGYLHVSLSGKGKPWQTFKHRLIALTFHPNKNNLPQVNHKDEDKLNNREDNLEWCTNQYNQSYSKSKLLKFKNPKGELIEVLNLSLFCKENDIHKGCMTHVHNGVRKMHKGWTKA